MNCAMCDETLEEKSEEEEKEMREELLKEFGVTPEGTPCAIICDSCYQKIIGAKRTNN